MRGVTLLFALTMAATAASPPGRPALRADKILILKSRRQLTLLHHGRAVKTYRVALGHSPRGAKQCEGDNRTPEGIYRVDSRNINSKYHRSLHVSYPDARDRANARKRHCRAGGDIMIHGITNGFGWLGGRHRDVDWTLGCIAVTNEEIEEIWAAVPNGTVVEIRP
jgi:murein L,D-transpeptidase YafK